MHTKFGYIRFSRSGDIIAYVKIENGPFGPNHSSFSRSRDMIGAHQNLNGSRDLTTPFSGMVCHPRASTCYDQPIYQI